MSEENAGVAAGSDGRGFGPWEVSEAAGRVHERGRIDLGGLVIRGAPGMAVRLDGADAGPIAVTLTLGDSSVQLQAFTAVAGSGLWRKVRNEILDGLRKADKPAVEVHGPLGDEVVAHGGASAVSYPLRFAGCDGPGWLLRAVFSGPAALDHDAAEVFERVFRDTIVVPTGQSHAERAPFILRPPNKDAASTS